MSKYAGLDFNQKEMEVVQNYFTWLSKVSHNLMQKGKWAELIPCLNEMAGVMNRESRYVDELKLYMFMLHIIIDSGRIEFAGSLSAMRKADGRSGLTYDEKRRLFYEVAIEGLPEKISADEKFSIYELCISDKIDDIPVLIHNRLVKYR